MPKKRVYTSIKTHRLSPVTLIWICQAFENENAVVILKCCHIFHTTYERKIWRMQDASKTIINLNLIIDNLTNIPNNVNDTG